MVPSFKDIGNETITLEVGVSKTRHVVHRDLLIKESPYFKAMFEGPWKDGTGGIVPLQLADSAVMPFFLDWLYFRQMPDYSNREIGPGSDSCLNCGQQCVSLVDKDDLPFDLENLTDEEDARLEVVINDPEIDQNLHLYVFADQYDFPVLRKALVQDKWWDLIENEDMPFYASVIKCFRHLPAHSPMSRLLMDAYVASWAAKDDSICPYEMKLRVKLPSNFTFMLAAKLGMKATNPQPPYIGPVCEYHEHPQDDQARRACLQELKEDSKNRIDNTPKWDEIEKKRLALDKD